jgi:hypothetical protein
MDDTYLVSVTSEIASSIRENVRALSVEIEGTDGDGKIDTALYLYTTQLWASGFKLIVDKHMHRCEVPTNCTVELWKSLDGVHSLKSNDMQRALISEAESQRLNLDRSQHWFVLYWGLDWRVHNLLFHAVNLQTQAQDYSHWMSRWKFQLSNYHRQLTIFCSWTFPVWLVVMQLQKLLRLLNT